jgi:hypothetical protein
LLEDQLSSEQKNTIKNAPPQPVNVAPQPARPGARSGPVLKFVSGPNAPVKQPASYPNQLVSANPSAQALMATTRVMPPHQVKATLLTVAKERQREVRVLFFFVCTFFALCLLILLLGVVLLFLPNLTTAGAILTILGTLLSGIGGILTKSQQSTNDSLDNIIDKIQRT